MPVDLLERLRKARVQVAKLEAAVAERRLRELAQLPAQYHFDSVAEFIRAVEQAAGASNRGPGRRRGRPAIARVPEKRRRGRITAVVRKRVIAMIKSGKSGASAAKAVGISLPSVQNIKKAAGLTQPRAAKKRGVRKSAVRTKPAAKETPAPKAA
jgi:hypothetical protein